MKEISFNSVSEISLSIFQKSDYSFAIFRSWYLKNKVPPMAISKIDPATINVFIFFCR